VKRVKFSAKFKNSNHKCQLISFQLAKEVDELLAGSEDKFKGNVASVDTPSSAVHKPKMVKPASYVPTVPSRLIINKAYNLKRYT
jgi:hypothetical protein